ncbi:MAG: translation initiation factor IF-3 [Rickettsiales bacterium]|nr:translation initiation factor IF-3 [Rickettsiales bacterium]
MNAKRDKGPRINHDIDAPKIRFVGPDGEMVGIVSPSEALKISKAAGLDLVEISPNAEPPVCKALDYGKFKYEQQKKQHDAKKKQKVQNVKEVKLRPNIGDHDFEIKMKAAHKFLDAGDKVKVTLRFRGREMAHQEIGMALLNRVKEHLGDKIRVENNPSFEGRQVVMMVSPAA